MVRTSVARTLALSLGMTALATISTTGPAVAIVGPGNPPNPPNANSMATPSGGNFPAVAEVSSDGGLGTGTLVSPMHVVTAAHNFFDGNGNQTANSGTVKFEIPDPANQGQTIFKEYDFSKVIIHPVYVDTMSATNDIAIIKLDEMIPGTQDANAMGMGIDPLQIFMDMNPNDDMNDIMEMGNADLVGWGNTGDGTSGVKRDGDNTVEGRATRPMESEKDSLLTFKFDAPGTGNALPREAGTGSGDSGGPAILDGRVAGVLVGASPPTYSFPNNGGNAAQHNSTLTYTRTQAYKDRFITPVLEDEMTVVADSGNWIINDQQDIGPAHFDMDTLLVSEIAEDLGPFDLKIMVPDIPMGGAKMISIDKDVLNLTGQHWTDFRMELGTMRLEADVPGPNQIGGKFYVTSTPDDDLYFKQLPVPLEENGRFQPIPFPITGNEEPVEVDHLWWFQDLENGFRGLDPELAAQFWLGINVPDLIDGMEDGMAVFTLRQIAMVPEPSTVMLLSIAAVGLMVLRRWRAG